MSDVPVGILLSGGLDSGLLLALMNEQGGPWPAYTIGYGDTYADDELRDAAETAALLGARHVTVTLDRAAFGVLIGPGFLDHVPGAIADDLPSNIGAIRAFLSGCADLWRVCRAIN